MTHMPGPQGFTFPNASDFSNLQQQLEAECHSHPALNVPRLLDNPAFARLREQILRDTDPSNLRRTFELHDENLLQRFINSQNGGGGGEEAGNRPHPFRFSLSGEPTLPVFSELIEEPECCCIHLWRWLKETIFDPIGRCFQRIFCCCDNSDDDSDYAFQDQLLHQGHAQQQIHQQMQENAAQVHQNFADQQYNTAFQG